MSGSWTRGAGCLSRFTTCAGEDIFPIWSATAAASRSRRRGTAARAVPETDEWTRTRSTPAVGHTRRSFLGLVARRTAPALRAAVCEDRLGHLGAAARRRRHAVAGHPDQQRRTGARLLRDGKWIAYLSNASGHRRSTCRRFPFRARDCKCRGRRRPGAMAGDGRELFYVALDGRMMAVPSRPPRTPRRSMSEPRCRCLRHGLVASPLCRSTSPPPTASDF